MAVASKSLLSCITKIKSIFCNIYSQNDDILQNMILKKKISLNINTVIVLHENSNKLQAQGWQS